MLFPGALLGGEPPRFEYAVEDVVRNDKQCNEQSGENDKLYGERDPSQIELSAVSRNRVPKREEYGK